MIAVLAFSMLSGSVLADKHAIQMEAASAIKFHTAMAHMHFENMLSGDKLRAMARFHNSVQRAKWYAQALLGPCDDKAEFEPLEDPGLRVKMRSVLSELEKFESLALERNRAWRKSLPTEDIDRRFHAAFKSITTAAAGTESAVKTHMKRDVAVFRTIQFILAAAILLMAAAIIALLNFYRRQQSRHFTYIEQSKKRAQQQNSFLRHVLESLAHPFYVIDAETYEVKLANSAAAGPDRDVCKTCYSITHRTDRPCAEVLDHPCPLEQVRKTAEPYVTEHVHYDHDGAPKYVEVHCYPIKDRLGNFSEVIEYTLDVTERKAAEKRLQKNMQELERTNQELVRATARANDMATRALVADAAKSQFLANMSHEIRTPMNAIIGFTEILAESGLGPEQLEHVQIIKDSGRGLLKLINDILDLSKIEAGKLEVDFETCQVDSIIDSVERMIALKAAEKSIDFEVRRADNLPERIFTDPARIRQCLLNLAGNAVKFTNEGYVRINVCRSDCDGGDWIRFDVEDTGHGVDKDMQDKIFGAFVQADGSSSRKHGGTGLGLTITKSLVELLGGSLTLESTPGKGSLFTILIPAAISAEAFVTDSRDPIETPELTNEPAPQTDANPAPGRILVAEDVATNQKLIRLMLERMGLEVEIAEDGRIAVEKCSADSFDLVFMDIQMPNMDGYEATAALRQNGLSTPIIALTANAMKGDEQACLDAGCDAYLAKPVSNDKLRQILHKYLPAPAHLPTA